MIDCNEGGTDTRDANMYEGVMARNLGERRPRGVARKHLLYLKTSETNDGGQSNHQRRHLDLEGAISAILSKSMVRLTSLAG